MSAFFGPGGNSEAFKAAGGKSTLDAPRWLKSIGLDAYEYEAGNGLAASQSMLFELGKEASEQGIRMSYIHRTSFRFQELKRKNDLKV